MSVRVEKRLAEIGLSQKEVSVYVALLELGEANAQDIATKSDVNRATTYTALETLMVRGLISSHEVGGVTLFIANDPYKLLVSIESDEEVLEKKKAIARTVIPELQEVFNASRGKKNVRVFDGKESIRIIQNEVIRSEHREFFNITNLSLALKHWPVTGDDYRKDVYKKEFTGHVIVVYDSTEKVPSLPAFAGEVERRYLPMARFPIRGELSLYDGDKIALITLEEPLHAISIHDKTLHDLLLVMFRCLWETAEQYSLDIHKK